MAYIFYIYIFFFTFYVKTQISLSSVFVHRNLMELYRCLYYVCYTRAENLTLRSAHSVPVFVLKFEIKIENQILRIIRAGCFSPQTLNITIYYIHFIM